MCALCTCPDCDTVVVMLVLVLRYQSPAAAWLWVEATTTAKMCTRASLRLSETAHAAVAAAAAANDDILSRANELILMRIRAHEAPAQSRETPSPPQLPQLPHV